MTVIAFPYERQRQPGRYGYAGSAGFADTLRLPSGYGYQVAYGQTSLTTQSTDPAGLIPDNSYSLTYQKAIQDPSPGTQIMGEALDCAQIEVVGITFGSSWEQQLSQLEQQYEAAGSQLYRVAVYEADAGACPIACQKAYRIIVVHSIAPLVFLTWAAIVLVGVYLLAEVLHWTTVVQAFQQFFNQLHQACQSTEWCSPLSTATHEYLIIAGFGVGAAFLVWLLSNWITERQSHGKAHLAPPAPPGVTTPSFGVKPSFEVHAGPVKGGVAADVEQHGAQGAPGTSSPTYAREEKPTAPPRRRSALGGQREQEAA